MRARAEIIRRTSKKTGAAVEALQHGEIQVDVFIGGINMTLWMDVGEAEKLSEDLLFAVAMNRAGF